MCSEVFRLLLLGIPVRQQARKKGNSSALLLMSALPSTAAVLQSEVMMW